MGIYLTWLPDFYLRGSASSSIIAQSLQSEQPFKLDDHPSERRHRRLKNERTTNPIASLDAPATPWR